MAKPALLLVVGREAPLGREECASDQLTLTPVGAIICGQENSLALCSNSLVSLALCLYSLVRLAFGSNSIAFCSNSLVCLAFGLYSLVCLAD